MIPTDAVGKCNKTWLEIADKVIPEVNTKPPARMEGQRTTSTTARLSRRAACPLPLTHADDRIGDAHPKVGPGHSGRRGRETHRRVTRDIPQFATTGRRTFENMTGYVPSTLQRDEDGPPA